MPTKYDWKSTSRPSSSVTIVRSRSSVAGRIRRPSPQRAGDLGGHRRQRRAGGEPVGAVEVGAEVAVAELEPRLAAVGGQRLHRLPRLADEPPAGLGVHRAGEGVGDRVEVGADVQAVQHGVVADVDDRGDVGRVDHLEQAGEEASRPDAAGQDGDAHFSAPVRRPRRWRSGEYLTMQTRARTPSRQPIFLPSA